MANPLTSYILEGTVRKGPLQGFSEVITTVTGVGGKEVNLYVSDGTELALNQTITLTHTSSGKTLTADTNANGFYALDLANLPGLSVGDEIKLKVDTRAAVAATEGLDIRHKASKAYKVLQVDERGKEYDEDYPFPVVQAFQLFGHPDIRENCSTVWGRRSDGQPNTETVTLPDGTSYQRTFGYTGRNLTSQSRWIKQ